MDPTTGDPAMSLRGATGLGMTTDGVTDLVRTGARTHTTTMTAKRRTEKRYDTVMITTGMTDTRTSGSAPAAALDPLTGNRENPSSIQATNLIQMLMPGLQRIMEGACPLNSW